MLCVTALMMNDGPVLFGNLIYIVLNTKSVKRGTLRGNEKSLESKDYVTEVL